MVPLLGWMWFGTNILPAHFRAGPGGGLHEYQRSCRALGLASWPFAGGPFGSKVQPSREAGSGYGPDGPSGSPRDVMGNRREQLRHGMPDEEMGGAGPKYTDKVRDCGTPVTF